MRKRFIWGVAVLGIAFIGLWAAGYGWAQTWPALKVGDEAPAFQLPSSQDRLVDYYRDYYGKHHLIITFFPAAFTPV